MKSVSDQNQLTEAEITTTGSSCNSPQWANIAQTRSHRLLLRLIGFALQEYMHPAHDLPSISAAQALTNRPILFHKAHPGTGATMRNTSRWLMALLLTGLAAGSVAASDATSLPAAPDSAGLDQVIEGAMQESGLIGLGAAIILDRQLVWSKGYGHADLQKGLPFTVDTVMNIGSISKTVTGVALMQAVQEGKLSLDEDINRYLPFAVRNPDFADLPITLRMLATHTSGITDRWEVYRDTYHWGSDAPQPLGDFLKAYFVVGSAHYSRENFLPHAPGKHREYSNIGAGLAGYIIERAMGQPLNQLTREHIFAPLGMDRSTWFLAETDLARHSTLYVAQDGMSIPISLYGITTYPDGGVRTSVADLSRFFIALLDGGQYRGVRILDPTTAAEMLRFQFTEANKPDNVELAEKNSGIFWSTKFNVTRVGHGGSDPGVRTEMLADPSKGIAVILMTNTSLSGADGKAYATLLEALWKHAEVLRKQK